MQPSPSVAVVAVTLAEATTVTEAATGAFTTDVAGVMEAMPAAKVVAEVVAAVTGAAVSSGGVSGRDGRSKSDCEFA